MGSCCSAPGPLLVPIPFPDDAVSMSFFGDDNIDKCISYLHDIVTTSPERAKTLRRVRTYVLTATTEDSDGEEEKASITVTNPVDEIIAVYDSMRQRQLEEAEAGKNKGTSTSDAYAPAGPRRSMVALRREHALCFLHRDTLRKAGLCFYQPFDINLFNTQLPRPMEPQHAKALVKLFCKINVSSSGVLSRRQFRRWVTSLGAKRTAQPVSEDAEDDMMLSLFVPLLMLINPTVQVFELRALEFCVMVHDLACMPDRALTDAMFDALRNATTTFTRAGGVVREVVDPASRARRRASTASRERRRSSSTMPGDETKEMNILEGVHDGVETLVLEDVGSGEHTGSPGKTGPGARTTPGTGSAIVTGAGVGVGGTDGSPKGPLKLHVKSKIMQHTVPPPSPARFRGFTGLDTIADVADEDEDIRNPANEVPGERIPLLLERLMAPNDETNIMAEEKAYARAGTGKKTVMFVPKYMGCPSNSAFLAGFSRAQDLHDKPRDELYDALRLKAMHRAASFRFDAEAAAVKSGYLTRDEWHVMNELNSEILAPVFEMRNRVQRAVLGEWYWVQRHLQLAEAAREREVFEAAGVEDQGLLDLGEVGLTEEHHQWRADQAASAPAPVPNRFEIVQNSGAASPVEVDAARRSAFEESGGALETKSELPAASGATASGAEGAVGSGGDGEAVGAAAAAGAGCAARSGAGEAEGGGEPTAASSESASSAEPMGRDVVSPSASRSRETGTGGTMPGAVLSAGDGGTPAPVPADALPASADSAMAALARG